MRDKLYTGDALTAGQLNRIVDAVVDRLTAGNGAYITRAGGKATLSARSVAALFTGGVGLTIEAVTALPPIPTVGPKIVWWLDSSRGGSGDNQLWAACPGQSEWTPLQNWTWLSGEPSS